MKTPQQVLAENANVLDLICNDMPGAEDAYGAAIVELLRENGYVVAKEDQLLDKANKMALVVGDLDCAVCPSYVVAGLNEMTPELKWVYHPPGKGEMFGTAIVALKLKETKP